MANEKEMFGLPLVLIEFKTKGVSAIKRSARGIVAMVLKQEDTDAMNFYKITSIDDIPEIFTGDNLDYIKQVLMGTPLRLLVQTIPKESVIEAKIGLDDALRELNALKWNYICMPEAKEEEMSDLVSWIKTKRNINRKTFKAVISGVEADHEGVINFATEDIKVGEKIYTPSKYTPRIAGILAGLALDRSATYFKLTEVDSIRRHEEPDKDINKGQMILVDDGEYIKIGRACNSLVTFTTDHGEEFRKIKIMEGVDMVTDDIRDTFHDRYVGNIINDYDHKVLFIAAIHVYFSVLEGNVLDRNAKNMVEISYDEQRNYAILKGEDVDKMEVMEILKYNTGDNVFLAGSVKFVDAMENLKLSIFM